MFAEAIENILADNCTSALIRKVESGGSAEALWNEMSDAGFIELMADEAEGGAGLELDGIYPIFVSFGRRAVPVPVAQTIAARVLMGEAAPAGMITLAGHCHRGPDGSLRTGHVAFGTMADFVLANLDGNLLLLDCVSAERQPTGVHGSLSATLTWPKQAVAAPIGSNGSEVAVVSATIHAAAMAGAMERLFSMTLEYCNDRVQFGKPIGKFQAVQHQLAVMAEHIACAGVATELAFKAGAKVPALLPAATAKACTSTAVTIVASIAHALHGAIGITEEFDLQLYTRRLHEWRMADGSEAYWNRIVGEALLARPQQTVLDFVKEQAL